MSALPRQFFATALCLLTLSTVMAAEPSSGWPAIFEKTTQAVVRVQATTIQERESTTLDETFFGKRFPSRVKESKVGGSGFFIDNKGTLLTTQSAIGGAKVASVEIGGGKRYQAKVIATDELLDIALLQVDNLTSHGLSFGDSALLRVGAPVATVGFPYEMNQSFWVGVISAHAVPSPSFPGISYLQADIYTNRGQAGSPLLNEKGEVIGMLNSIYTSSGGYSGISLAHPSALLLRAIDELKAGKTYQRRYIGISGEVQWHPASDGTHETRQVMVLDVGIDSPASKAGIQPDDVIIQFNGVPVTSWDQFAGLVQMATPNIAVAIEIQRGASRLSVAVTPVLREHDTHGEE
ncbi:S1C family serine protease [Permianibacter aggregans]|uniref:S1-C subfamily serine protease n=1 Tax=Permianibacter aggregans TaxID=1510150 RepID=A0A4R6UM05_9GAMM|nr:trypsin-like peptidase domain-containing protein [Permianibacter aggregans]QGX41025.1 PDZ domain-containing protein [Permianibacter aggregans]TDQ48090.1 S1-C subfamily serine protease [Permianibacter aggregans]